MMNFLTTGESFFLVSDDLMHLAESMSEMQPLDRAFFGYCFHQGKYFHYQHENPSVDALSQSYEFNCGVFLAVRKLTDRLEIFTDPLGQYPVFYYASGKRIAVSNNFWAVSIFAGQQFNTECALDLVTYFSPLGRETLCKEVFRLRAFETISITEELVVNKRRMPFFQKRNYSTLLDEARQRFGERARATLAAGTPVLHLTGGTDSRVSFSALLAQDYRGPVFSYGDGRSQDRLVFEHLVERFGLEKGLRKWFSAGHSGHHFMRAVHAFQAFKSNSFGNWGPGHDKTYMEVTGYFGEGLLKGFGTFWDRRGSLVIFNGAKKSSALPNHVFEKTLARVQSDLNFCLEIAGGNRRMANSLFYIYNRSAAHFGLHSMICNTKFRSVDLLYDPQLLQLLYNCPHSDEHILNGSLSVDLIRTLHSDELAHIPYESRVIPVFDDKAEQVVKCEEMTCFSNIQFEERSLPALRPELIKEPDKFLDKMKEYPLTYIHPSEIFKNDLFAGLFEDVPEIKTIRTSTSGGKRSVELVSLSTLAIGHWLVKHPNLRDYV